MIRTFVIVIFGLGASASTLSAQDPTTPLSDLVGCYRLTVGAWTPTSFAESNAHFTDLPRELELRDERTLTPGVPVSFRASGHALYGGLQWQRWWLVAEDSIVVVTSTAMVSSGVRLVLSADHDGVSGRAYSFLYGSAVPEEPTPIDARARVAGDRIPCSGRARDDGVRLRLSGVVVDEATGAPLAGATVSIPATYSLHTVHTDSAGMYLIEDTRNRFLGLTAVEAFLPGFFPEERYRRLWCQVIVVLVGKEFVCELQLDFWMRPLATPPSSSPTCSVTGRMIYDIDERPSARGIVQVEGSDIGAVAGPDGSYVLRGVPAGFHRISARMIGTLRQRRLVWVSCAQPSEGPSLSFWLIPQPLS